MSLKSLLKDTKITRVENAAAAGTTDLKSTVLDMAGYENVCFVAILGDATSGSVLELKVYGNTADSDSSPTPVELTSDSCQYTAGASDADNKMLIVDVVRPAYRYVFSEICIDTQNCALDAVLAVQYNGDELPITQGSTVLASALIGPGV
jgi:hypothetical protein